MPGTHLGFMDGSDSAPDEEGIVCSCPAGTLVLHHQSILHRRHAITRSMPRHMLKFNYWRSSPPAAGGDWVHEPGFDLRTACANFTLALPLPFGRFASMTSSCFGRADFGGHGIAKYVADSMFWLLGRGDEYRLIGGQGWPWSNQELLGPSYGKLSRYRWRLGCILLKSAGVLLLAGGEGWELG